MAQLEVQELAFEHPATMSNIPVEKHAREERGVLVSFDNEEVTLNVAGGENEVYGAQNQIASLIKVRYD